MTMLAAQRASVPPGGSARVLALLADVPSDVDGVVDRLERLQATLTDEHGERDGVTCFNRLYRQITADVRDQLGVGEAADEDFLARLVVEFAGRYLQALRADAAGAPPPRSWAVLLDRRSRRRTDPVEHAVVGITAHVNLDLAPAVVRTCTVLGHGAPGPGERADFRTLHDAVVAHTIRLVERGGHCGTVVAGVPVVLAGDAVWRQALGLWEQRSRPTEYERELDALDRRTALLGRGLLTRGALT